MIMPKKNILKFTLIGISVIVAIIVVGLGTITALRIFYPNDSSKVDEEISQSVSKEDASKLYDEASTKLQSGELDEAEESYTEAKQFYETNPEETPGRSAEIDAQLRLIEVQRKAQQEIKNTQPNENSEQPGIVTQ